MTDSACVVVGELVSRMPTQQIPLAPNSPKTQTHCNQLLNDSFSSSFQNWQLDKNTFKDFPLGAGLWWELCCLLKLSLYHNCDLTIRLRYYDEKMTFIFCSKQARAIRRSRIVDVS